jgi:hypothetical protein
VLVVCVVANTKCRQSVAESKFSQQLRTASGLFFVTKSNNTQTPNTFHSNIPVLKTAARDEKCRMGKAYSWKRKQNSLGKRLETTSVDTECLYMSEL